MSEYETDIVTWSRRQASLLERIARGDRTNETPDWANIIEEVRDVGGSAVRAVRSLLFQALLHHLKATAWPHSLACEHWKDEIRVMLVQAEDTYLPSMRQQIDIADIYAKALRAMPKKSDGQLPGAVPATCPFTLDELLESVREQS